ncbi:MAG: DUF2059 domain-containing protein [Methylobacteriaceae bacterium]|nr:DUF2059 domain-containing protein [Methylobacteriaceae bacterium]
MSFLLRPAAALLLLALSALPGRAQEPSASHLAAARDLVQLVGSASTVDEMLPSFAEQIRRNNITRPELTKDLNDVLQKLEPEMQLQKQQIVTLVAKTYAKYLTEPEIRDTLAFFKTPAGAKYLAAQPQLVDAVVDDIANWAQQASDYLLVRVRAEMAKRGQQLQ